jgi:predicted neutral ceramidase superfamily lipid hydrolase
VLACVDLGKGIFGKQGGQGGSLRKSLCKRDLFSSLLLRGRGGREEKVQASLPDFHRLSGLPSCTACLLTSAPHPISQKRHPSSFLYPPQLIFICMYVLSFMYILALVYNQIVKYIIIRVYTHISIYSFMHILISAYNQVFVYIFIRLYVYSCIYSFVYIITSVYNNMVMYILS